MDKVQLQDLPWYSRVRSGANEFNYYFVENDKAICFDNEGKESKLNPEMEVEFISSMKEYDLSK